MSFISEIEKYKYNDQYYFIYRFEELASNVAVLNVQKDIFDVFEWSLAQHMNDILVNGENCKKLIVTFDSDIFDKGNFLITQISSL